ncbi:MAG TPA: hypothetical protein VGH16_14275, partial [Candidatus Binatia bacterium]
MQNSASAVRRLLTKSPSPATARAHLGRLLDTAGPDSVAQLAAEDLPLLARLLGASGFLSDVLIRQGDAWPEVFHRQINIARKTAAEHTAEIAVALDGDAELGSVAGALRRHKQIEYLRIGARDLRAEQVEETMCELSALADGSLDIAYRFGRAAVERDFGRLEIAGRPPQFVVIGMGKLGGGELNFSSDIDLIYLYEDDEGESSGGPRGKLAARDFFSRVAEAITR